MQKVIIGMLCLGVTLIWLLYLNKPEKPCDCDSIQSENIHLRSLLLDANTKLDIINSDPIYQHYISESKK
jgi:hypothetical protein